MNQLFKWSQFLPFPVVRRFRIGRSNVVLEFARPNRGGCLFKISISSELRGTVPLHIFETRTAALKIECNLWLVEGKEKRAEAKSQWHC